MAEGESSKPPQKPEKSSKIVSLDEVRKKQEPEIDTTKKRHPANVTKLLLSTPPDPRVKRTPEERAVFEARIRAGDSDAIAQGLFDLLSDEQLDKMRGELGLPPKPEKSAKMISLDEARPKKKAREDQEVELSEEANARIWEKIQQKINKQKDNPSNS
jgi:hypothetical protein